MGERLTVLLDDDNADWVTSEATERDRSKAYIINEALKAARGEASTYEVSTASVNGGEAFTASELRDRLDALEDAVFNDNAAQARDSPADARDTPTPQAPKNDDSNADVGDMDDLRAELGEWLIEHGPQTEHGRRGVLRCVDELEARGPLTSEELTDMLEDEIGDQYSRRKSMWESIKRHLQNCPAVRETEDYQTWAFVGVEETRDKL